MDRTYIIAEAGVNHNGSLEMAKELIEVAHAAGADAVKFQTFKAEKVISRNAPKAEYQMQTTEAEESQLEMAKKLEFDEDTHRVLIQHSEGQGIQFLSTPFDLDSVTLLAETLDLPRLKIPSGEITNAPLLFKAARFQKPLILSTGMSTLGEVETALGVLALGYIQPGEAPSISAFQSAFYSETGQHALRNNVVLLHCTTEYPTPFNEVNLRVIQTLHNAFGMPVGLSDHTQGISIPIAAVSQGASVIEKHFTLDRALPGPDHQASLEPDALKEMVRSIRQVEQALGRTLKVPTLSERKNKIIARKSLVAACDIQREDVLTQENLTIKRPGNGISPLHYWEWLGKKAEKNYSRDELL